MTPFVPKQLTDAECRDDWKGFVPDVREVDSSVFSSSSMRETGVELCDSSPTRFTAHGADESGGFFSVAILRASLMRFSASPARWCGGGRRRA